MSRRQLTIGVLGHVDHGKTALVKALTGTDTDRLEEEKRRGLSIVLGFAYLEQPSGMIDLIDVPGHESFIRTMIAGATGFDGVLLVVSAEEGIKPQTAEHFDIARLLGIRRGLIAVTKRDLVDDKRLQEVTGEIRAFVRGTFLEGAPVHPVSALDGSGLSGLQEALNRMITEPQERPIGYFFSLPLDRVFTMGGFGTVATGTLRKGRLSPGDEVEIMPAGIRAGVREVQVHKARVDSAVAGQRVAVNLRGVKRDQVAAGDVLITPGSVRPATGIYARLQILEDVPRLPKRNEAVRLLFGTTEVIAKLRLLDRDALEPGTDALVQIRCRQPVIAGTGERFILRTCSPVTTIGGGEFLDTSASLATLPRAAAAAHLERLEKADLAGRVQEYVRLAGTRGVTLSSLLERTSATRSGLLALLESAGIPVIEDNIAIGRSALEELSALAMQGLADHHRDEPSQPGMRLENFRLSLQQETGPVIIEYLIKHLGDAGSIRMEGSTIRLADFSQEDGISDTERELIHSIEKIFREGQAAPPELAEVIGRDRDKKRAYEYLKDAGRLIPLRDTSSRRLYVFHRDTLEEIQDKLIREFPPPKPFTVAEVRSLVHSTRKYVVPLLEYLDRSRFTVRRGDLRTVLIRENNK